MLEALSIRDVVLIDKLDLEFGDGLSVLTGETGAGKSILLDAFSLALGGRGDAALVRRGAGQGQVTAIFALPANHPVLALLAANFIEPEPTLILRRVQGADGRSRAFINDTSVSVQLLREVGRALVEIHGQHDDRALIDPSGHRDLVDAFGALGGEAARVAEAHALWQRAEAERSRHESDSAAALANAGYLGHALEELRVLNPQAGEEEQLAARRQVMMNSEKLAAELAETLDALRGEGTNGARLAAALRRLERQAPVAPDLLGPVATSLARVLEETNAAQSKVEEALAATDFEPEAL
jgi:DNA repair protein RecN (Recombination protein N)